MRIVVVDDGLAAVSPNAYAIEPRSEGRLSVYDQVCQLLNSYERFGARQVVVTTQQMSRLQYIDGATVDTVLDLARALTEFAGRAQRIARVMVCFYGRYDDSEVLRTTILRWQPAVH